MIFLYRETPYPACCESGVYFRLYIAWPKPYPTKFTHVNQTQIRGTGKFINY